MYVILLYLLRHIVGGLSLHIILLVVDVDVHDVAPWLVAERKAHDYPSHVLLSFTHTNNLI